MRSAICWRLPTPRGAEEFHFLPIYGTKVSYPAQSILIGYFRRSDAQLEAATFPRLQKISVLLDLPWAESGSPIVTFEAVTDAKPGILKKNHE